MKILLVHNRHARQRQVGRAQSSTRRHQSNRPGATMSSATNVTVTTSWPGHREAPYYVPVACGVRASGVLAPPWPGSGTSEIQA
jgi:hypothetical protein